MSGAWGLKDRPPVQTLNRRNVTPFQWPPNKADANSQLNVAASKSAQVAASDWRSLPSWERRTNKAPLRQEAVMSECNVFRLYAKEAMQESLNAVDEADRQALEELACTWAQAALMSDRVFGSSWTPLNEATSRVDGQWRHVGQIASTPVRARSRCRNQWLLSIRIGIRLCFTAEKQASGLEAPFWAALHKIASERRQTISNTVAFISEQREADKSIFGGARLCSRSFLECHECFERQPKRGRKLAHIIDSDEV
jgi:hypothetical protein